MVGSLVCSSIALEFQVIYKFTIECGPSLAFIFPQPCRRPARHCWPHPPLAYSGPR
jgi:hypothetical protein